MRVEIAKGIIEGKKDGNTIKFAGVPYAKAPVGNLRFRDPVPVDGWDGVFEAFEYKKDPMQNYQKRPFEEFSEDCLYLNIWVPDHGKDKYPVMVWIPGGAYATGGCGAPTPDGPSLYEGAIMADDMDAIVVAVSYRLNIFGFLNLSQFSEKFDDNLGLKDLVMALKWVQDNIEAFGGDKDCVTLFGESAGAGCISTILMMDCAKDLFNRVIMQSNCFGSYYTVEEETDICRKYLELLGLDENNAEGILDKTYEEIYAATAKLDVYALTTYFPRCTFCPVVDGEFVSDYPTLGNYAGMDKEILVGSNKYEGNFLMKSMNMTKEQSVSIARNAFHRLPAERIDKMVSEYPLPGKQAIADVITDVMYTFPKLRLAERASADNKVFVFRYDYATPVMEMMGFKACHVAEMLPLWNITAKPYDALRKMGESNLQAIGKRMRKYWGAFAATGDPQVDGQIEWKAYESGDRFTMVIDKKDHLEKNPESACLRKFEGLDRVVV